MENEKKRARRVVVEGNKLLIMTEVAFKESDFRPEVANFFTAFDAKAVRLAIAAIEQRVNHCVSDLQKHVANAKVINQWATYWDGGHFTMCAYEAMESAIEKLTNSVELNRAEAIQLLKAIKKVNFFSDEYKAICEKNPSLKVDASTLTNLTNYIFDVACEMGVCSKD